MATRIKPTKRNLYDEDFYVWAQNQAELLRDKHFGELDLANLIEEVEDLAGSLKSAVRSRATHGASTQAATRTGPEPSIGLARDHSDAAHASSERPHAIAAAPCR